MYCDRAALAAVPDGTYLNQWLSDIHYGTAVKTVIDFLWNIYGRVSGAVCVAVAIYQHKECQRTAGSVSAVSASVK